MRLRVTYLMDLQTGVRILNFLVIKLLNNRYNCLAAGVKR